MSKVIVLNIQGTPAANEVIDKLRLLQHDHLIDLRDAFVAERDEYGKAHVTQAIVWWSRAEDSTEGTPAVRRTS